MKQYRVTGRQVSLASGLLLLSPEQASARAHLLRDGDFVDLYHIEGTVHFKRGEVFGFDGDLGKGMTDLVEESDFQPSEFSSEVQPPAESTPESQGDDDLLEKSAREIAAVTDTIVDPDAIQALYERENLREKPRKNVQDLLSARYEALQANADGGES